MVPVRWNVSYCSPCDGLSAVNAPERSRVISDEIGDSVAMDRGKARDASSAFTNATLPLRVLRCSRVLLTPNTSHPMALSRTRTQSRTSVDLETAVATPTTTAFEHQLPKDEEEAGVKQEVDAAKGEGVVVTGTRSEDEYATGLKLWCIMAALVS